jgi:hypothetical protein
MDQFELGDLYLKGQTEELHIIVGGGGSTYATDLPAQRVYLRTNADSEGSAHFSPKELLVGTHAGIGTVYYRGTPTTTLQVTGKGKLTRE